MPKLICSFSDCLAPKKGMKVIPTERRGKGPYCILNSHTFAVGGGASSAPPVCIILLRIWFLKMKGKLRNFTVRMCVLEPVSSGCGPRDICSFHLFRVLHFLELKNFWRQRRITRISRLKWFTHLFIPLFCGSLMILAAEKGTYSDPFWKELLTNFEVLETVNRQRVVNFLFLRSFLPL